MAILVVLLSLNNFRASSIVCFVWTITIDALWWLLIAVVIGISVFSKAIVASGSTFAVFSIVTQTPTILALASGIHIGFHCVEYLIDLHMGRYC